MTSKAKSHQEFLASTEDRDDTDEREETQYSYPALKIHQNGHDIYHTTIPVDDLFPFAFVDRSCDHPEEGYQRKYDERRAVEIAEYLSTQGKSIPGNIILSAQPPAELTYTRKNKQLSYLRIPEAFAVVDGQHRLWGYQKCSIRHRVPVAIYVGLDHEAEAQLFIDINTKQKGVPKSHLINVKRIAGTETAAEVNLRHLFTRLNTEAESPLKGKLTVGDPGPGKLSRVSFDNALLRAQKSDLIARQPIEKQYELILKYLRAIESVVAEKEQLLRRGYFGAIFDVFDDVVRKTKKEQNSVKLPALQSGVSVFSDISESNYPGPAKRQRLVDEMHRRLPSDTSIDADDI